MIRLSACATFSFCVSIVISPALANKPDNQICKKPIYLTFDTGNMAVAKTVAEILKRQQVKATFFLANEKTIEGDYSLDDGWRGFWQERVKEGHQFGSHTYDHVYFVKDLPSSDAGHKRVLMKAQFGSQANKSVPYSGAEVCVEINRVNARFMELTNRSLDPLWRAPGGKTSPELVRMGERCGYRHVGWSAAGFLGDELDSAKYPNSVLLEKALRSVKPGDITMAHLGIWSRKDAWAPAVLEPLIEGWKRQGYCFDLLPLNASK